MGRNSVVIVFLLVIIVAVGFFVFSPTSWLTSFIASNTQSLHKQLFAIQQKIPTQTGKNLFMTQSKNLTVKVNPELVDLDSQIISCDPNVNNLTPTNATIGGSCEGGSTTLSTTKGMYLGGQCCGTMTDMDEYNDNLKKLQSYKNIPDIPLNPHKTPIQLAQKWIAYDNTTTLTPDQQMVMDQSMKTSKEGPCCCKCWHYFTNEGIAKKLITAYHFNSKQIDEFWEASDIC